MRDSLDSLLPNGHFRYSRWDGTQHIAAFDAEELMEHLADDLLTDGDVRSALQRMLQRGFQQNQGGHTMGLQQLLERLRSRRQQQLDRYDLGGMIDQIKEKLEDVIATERDGIQRRLDEAGGQQGEEGSEDRDSGPGTDDDDAAESPAVRLADDLGAQSAIRSKQTVNVVLRAMKKRSRIV